MTGVVNFLKPTGMTSSDAVVCLKRIYGVKCGHLGTLDPDATGVLPIAVGNATRLFDYAEGEKEYIAGLRLGAVTTTGDASGIVIQRRDVIVGETEIKAVLPQFIGQIRQTPPLYSAVKINGCAAYKLARQDKAAELPEREVTIAKLEYLRRENDTTHVLRIRCSRGTYIRSLCADIGQALGCGAYMVFLVRAASVGMEIEQALTMEEIKANPMGALLPPDTVLADMPRTDVAGEYREKLFNGVAVPTEEEGTRRVYCDGEFFGVGLASEGNLKMKVRL